MTDTKHISDAIKGLPDEANIEAYSARYDSDDLLAQWKASDLKALVAENEALKERSEPWVLIQSVDDLPKTDGMYNFTFESEDGEREVRQRYVDTFFRQYLRAGYVAWKPLLKPYTTHGGNDD